MGDSRALGEQERLLHYMHPYGGLMPLQVMHIRGQLDADRVAGALKWLQRQHPMLRAHIRYGGPVFRSLLPFIYRQPYFDTEGTTEIPLQTVGGRWEDALTEELRMPLPRGRNPRLRVTFLREEAEDLNHLIFCADHATLDAQAAHLMCRQMLEYFADPVAMEAKAPVHERLPPPLEAGLPNKTSSGAKRYEPALRLPRQHVPGAKRATGFIMRQLDASATGALKTAVRANRTTIHGAISAAFLLAMHQKYGVEQMTCMSSVDLRRLCKPPLPAETYGCYIDVLRTRHTLGPDLWPIARDVSFKLISALAKDQEAASFLKLAGWEVYAAETWPTMTHHRRLDGLGITTAGDSKLPAHFGNYTLEGVTMAVAIDFIGPSLLVLAAERLGALDISICYATDAMPGPDVIELSDRALAALSTAAAEDKGVLA
jgi:hypothetical protein